MNKRAVFLIGTALVLAAVYIFYFTSFTDWIKPVKIQIMCRNFPTRGGHSATVKALTFYLDKPYQLTSIKIVSATEARTNKYPHALWYLVAETNSAPTVQFDYGAAISGMKPEIPHSVAEPLLPNLPYEIVIESGKKLKGQLTFNPRG